VGQTQPAALPSQLMTDWPCYLCLASQSAVKEKCCPGQWFFVWDWPVTSTSWACRHFSFFIFLSRDRLVPTNSKVKDQLPAGPEKEKEKEKWKRSAVNRPA